MKTEETTTEDSFPEETALGELQQWSGRYRTKDDIAKEMDTSAGEAGRKSKLGKLRKYAQDVLDAIAMLRDSLSGKYPMRVPFAALAALVAALAYIACPFDLLADFLPGVGLADDAAVLLAAVNFAKKDLQKYRAWRGQTPNKESNNDQESN